MAGKAIVFAGQGAQFVGMGKDLCDAFPECKALYAQADDVLGYGLSGICFDGPEEELTKSNHCQPAIFVTSIACYRALGVKAGALDFAGAAGLSLGEWSALHMAGALGFEDTLRTLEARGRFMQEACDARDGAMVSVIGLTRDKLDEICAEASVEVANLNSEGQTVLSGDRAGIEKAEQLANDAGAKRAIVLNVAGAYHSSLMSPAAEKLADFLADVTFAEPTVPVLSNVTGAPHAGADAIAGNMIKQVTSSVQWLSCVQWLRGNGADAVVECGPGRVLSGLIKRIDRDVALCNIQDLASLDKAAEALGA